LLVFIVQVLVPIRDSVTHRKKSSKGAPSGGSIHEEDGKENLQAAVKKILREFLVEAPLVSKAATRGRNTLKFLCSHAGRNDDDYEEKTSGEAGNGGGVKRGDGGDEVGDADENEKRVEAVSC